MKQITPEVGREVAIREGRSYIHYVTGWFITRITASGQVVVRRGDRERKFNHEGKEMRTLANSFPDGRLVTDIEWVREYQANKEARSASQKLIYELSKLAADTRGSWDRDTLLGHLEQLEQLLKGARESAEKMTG